jgi:hypothetical protein
MLTVYTLKLSHSSHASALDRWFGLFLTAMPKQPTSLFTPSDQWSVTPLLTLLALKICVSALLVFVDNLCTIWCCFKELCLHRVQEVNIQTLVNNICFNFSGKPNFFYSLADKLSKQKTIDLRDLRRLEARHRM